MPPLLFDLPHFTACGIGIGSNVGQRIENIICAGNAILGLHGTLITQLAAVAPVYESAPVGCPEGSCPFLNTVIEIETEARSQELMRFLLEIERNMGRPRERERNDPRVIDLDLLYYGQCEINENGLVVPHPRMHERRFVLQPLADIRPDLKLPGQDHTVQELLNTLSDDRNSVARVRDSNWLTEAQ